jgi:hypothetical protein
MYDGNSHKASFQLKAELGAVDGGLVTWKLVPEGCCSCNQFIMLEVRKRSCMHEDDSAILMR